MTLRTIVIDDELPARRRLKQLIAKETNWEVVAEAADCEEAIDLINDLSPHLILLDIQLKGQSGFDVLKRVENKAPMVVFVSAYDQFAIKAFDHFATDFLLKPFSDERFIQMAEVVQERFRLSSGAKEADQLALLSQSFEEGLAKDEPVIHIRERNRLVLIRLSELLAVTSSGNYCELHKADRKLLTREKISDLEARLEAFGFLRVHRKTILNMKCLEELSYTHSGKLMAVLIGGKQFSVSDSYERKIKRLLRWK